MKTRWMAFLFLIALPLLGAYQYLYSDTFITIDLDNWYQNGPLEAAGPPNGLYTLDYEVSSLISSIDAGNDYEVRTIIRSRLGYGGTLYHYLRASTDALNGLTPTGTFYSVEVENGGEEAGTLVVNKRVNGTLTQLGSVQIACPDGTEVRSIIRGNRLDVWVNGFLYLSLTDSSLAYGQPGIGVFTAGMFGTSIARVDLGRIDTTAPPAVSAQSIATYPLPNSVDMQWKGGDNTNGIGVGHYLIYRNGQFYEETASAEFTDEAVSPSTTYTYGIVARDYHRNDSTQTTFTVTTPPSDSVDTRRVGVRSLGSYWGASGEQIDTLSGNLNLTLPMFSAMGRNGWGVSFGLSYNSQLWRKDPAATWNLGRDVGYGFGWRLQAGSITPFWEDAYTIHHYTFRDSTGAEYRLDVPNQSEETWSSKDGVYLTYDRVTDRLWFPDGSFWVMGCASAGSEQDAGTRYPTRDAGLQRQPDFDSVTTPARTCFGTTPAPASRWWRTCAPARSPAVRTSPTASPTTPTRSRT